MMNARCAAFLQELSGKGREEIIQAALALFCEREEAVTRLTEFQNASHEMALQFSQMKEELKGARAELALLREQNQHLAGVRVLQSKELFGRSTEKADQILDAALCGTQEEDPLREDAPEEGDNPGTGTPGKNTGTLGKTPGRGKKKPGKRSQDLSALPVCKVFDYDIDALNEQYGEGNWRFAFWHEHRSVELIPESTYLQVTYTPVISWGLGHELVSIPYEDALLPGSLVSPSLMAAILVDKYAMFLPLYRQEHDPHRFGFPLSRQTMSNWVVRFSHELFLPVYDHLCAFVCSSRYQQCDETTYLVIRDGRAAGTKSFMWVHRTSELLDGPAAIVFCYEKTRAADHLRGFYAGQTQKIYLTDDAYSAYQTIGKEMPQTITVCGCFMHARRRFVDALSVLPTRGMDPERLAALPETKGISLIGGIYNAEEALKGLTPQERLIKRGTDVLEKVDAYFEFVNSFDTEDPAVSEKLKDAILYSRNQEPYLRRFLEDGNIPIDNGATERSIRPIAQGRRNYLFSYTVSGAEATAIVSTLVETAKANSADSYFYLKYLLEQMPKHIYQKDQGYLKEMVPWSDTYRAYEAAQKQNCICRQAPASMEKPRTPRKKDNIPQTA